VTFGRFSQDPAVGNEQTGGGQAATVNNQRVVINQVITDPELVQNSYQLENVLQTNNFIEYCNYKIENAKDQTQSSIWNFILVNHQKKNLLNFIKPNFVLKKKTNIKKRAHLIKIRTKSSSHCSGSTTRCWRRNAASFSRTRGRVTRTSPT
jgi:hypothetical protein